MIEILPNWHPVVVHFTIALLLTSSALFMSGALLARRPVGSAVTHVARWNLALGVVAAVVALVTGWQAYNTVAHDEPSHANMTIHLRWALGSAALFLAAAAAAWFDRRRAAGASGILLALVLAGSGALAVTGWLGGENVYRYGLGVKSLPKSDTHVHPGSGDGHQHEHGPGPGGEPAVKTGESSAKDGGRAASPPASPPASDPSAASPGGHSHGDARDHAH
ncbi:DUF2231 domain-containing protein [Methylobacterium durans]|uniref:DUF2231 domain-containing protein n=1 Tax=Methylobacterium durans TaxID=2202825 RepID=A0A2U8W8X0_9HYPH|nr:DUF2231 domain-containing protein [Methylobacterium durans]AWN42557.1 hypothetical protein DK389_21180 [Methylobacterium durans]